MPFFPRPGSIGAIAATSVAWLALGVTGMPPAAGQATACPPAGTSLLGPQITVREPLAGSAVSGTVGVKGRVEQFLLAADRAELRVNGVIVDSAVIEPESSEFSLQWDSASAAPGPATLRVVVCGERAGSSEKPVNVNVRPLATTPTAPPVTVKAPAPAPVEPSPGADGPVPVPAVGGSATTVAGRSTTTLVGAGEPLIEDRLPLLPPAEDAGHLDGGTGAAPSAPPLTEPLVLEDASDDSPARRPPWLGLVVGGSGVAGLVLSTVLRRRNERLGRSRGGSGGQRRNDDGFGEGLDDQGRGRDLAALSSLNR